MSQGALTLADVTKVYGNERVLAKVSLEFQLGETVLVLGSNGAGKSTLLRICAGLLRADGGSRELHSQNGSSAVGRAVGYVGHDSLLYAELTVAENLQLTQALLGEEADLTPSFENWSLTPLIEKRVRELSRGQQRRVALCRAFLSEPRCLFLDEPTNTLDLHTVEHLCQQLSTGCARRMTLIATHDVEHLLPIASRIVVLDAGCVFRDARETDKLLEAVEDYRKIHR